MFMDTQHMFVHFNMKSPLMDHVQISDSNDAMCTARNAEFFQFLQLYFTYATKILSSAQRSATKPLTQTRKHDFR